MGTKEVRPRWVSALRALRTRAGRQQGELAREVGLSRQALGALEAGTSIPATDVALALARALGCHVEDLFQIEDQAPLLDAVLDDPGARADGGRVALAEVDQHWVAHLLEREGSAGLLAPADGVVVPHTGNAVAPETGRARVRPLREEARLRQNLFAAGCDPGLALLAAHLSERWPLGRLHWLPMGSGRALERMAAREVHIAGVHLDDESRGEHNVAAVRRCLPGQSVVLMNLAVWEQGLVVAAGNPKRLRGLADLARRGIRVVGREPGSGAHGLFVRLAAAAGVPRKAIRWVTVAAGHLEVAHAVAVGVADAGVATRAAAVAHGLEFLPLAEARFDLVLGQQSASEERLARMLEVLASPRFKRDLGSLAGYGTTRTGQIVAELAA
jgi:putative molybdopterin biosynthesis protein